MIERPIEEYLSPADAAAYIGVSRRTINYWAANGLPTVRVNPTCTRIHPDDLDAYRAAHPARKSRAAR